MTKLNEAVMKVKIDKILVAQIRRKSRPDGLTPGERVAINLFAYHPSTPVPIAVLARVFRVSRNTIYYQALTGDADSYPNSGSSNLARETRELIGVLGRDEAWRRYVTDQMVLSINAEMARVASKKRISESASSERRRTKAWPRARA
jgi:hypothetical protein